MDPATITIILSILVQYGPEAYKLALGLFTKPTSVLPSDFDALTLLVNKPLHDPVVPALHSPTV
jgi:hypothetical protein